MKKFFGRRQEELDYYTEDEFEVMNLDEEYDEPEEAEEYYEIEDTEDEEYYEFEEAGDAEYYETEDIADEAYYEAEETEEAAYYEDEDADEAYYEAEETEEEEYYEIEDAEEAAYYEAEDTEYYELEETDEEEYYEAEETEADGYYESETYDEEAYYEEYDEAEEDGYYEMDEYGDESEYSYEEYQEEYEGDLTGGNVIEKVIAFLSNMSGMDRLIVATGALVLVFALVAGSLFVSAKTGERQVDAFAELGNELDDVEILGEGGLVAVSDAKFAQQEAAELAAKEEETETEEMPEEQIQVVMNLSSIQKDLKIKFINKKSSKLIASVPFEVEVVDAEGKNYSLIDEDMDGIIYQKGLVPGEYKVAMIELKERQEYSFSIETQKVKVKDKIVYEKVDVEDEIKSEAEVNAAVEDTKKQEAEAESSNKDTVAFVESTRTEVEGGSYKEISKATITDPATSAKALSVRDFMRLSVPVVAAPTVALSSSSEEISIGQSVQLTATVTDGVPIWESSNEAVATVSSDGKVEGISSGSVTITVTVTGGEGTTPASASCTVTVKETKISLNQTDISLYEGASAQLTATASDGGAVTWGSSDNSVATVDGNGKVTGVKAGNAVITASANGTSVTCAVKVSAAGTTISATTLSIKVGETATLTVDVDGADHKVDWVTSDGSIATVNEKGVVTGVKAGTATITATANGISATCAVTVVSGAVADTTTALKDNNGNQVYVQNRNGEYVPAVYADYYNYDKFYIKQSSYKYTGWQTIDGSVYYYDADGNVVKGTQVIQGATYNFDATTGALVTSSGTLGIDVSKWNGNIDWNAVKNSGIKYVIIRCGYRGSTTGALIEDPKFKANIKGATAAGLKVGVYFFTQATNEVEAVEEASMVLSLIKGYSLSYPVFLDVEPSGGRADSISKDARTAVCKAFCQTISNSGYAAGIYANKTWLESKLDPGSLGGYKIWLAQYAANATYGGRYEMWQYTSKGSVSGIKGDVDLNLSYLGY